MKRNPALYLICLWLLPILGLAQGQILKGQVLLVGDHDETKPTVGVDVMLKQTGDTVTTLAGGLFRLYLPDRFKAGEEITLQVTKPGWRIQYPLDGETHIPADRDKELIEIRLLPLGSKKFWSADRIEKFIQDTEDIDFSRYIKEWATQYGFSAQQVKAEIDQWIAKVQQKQDDLYKLGLAAYAEKKFGKASELFTLSAKTKIERREAVDQEQERLTQERERLTEEIVRDFRLAGDAEYNDYRFDKALAAYQQALGYVSKTQHPQLWAALTNEAASAHHKIGIRTQGPAIHEHLNAAITAYRNTLQVITRVQLPQDWARIQIGLGNALKAQGTRARGEVGQRLLNEAVAAYRNALQIITREHLPQDWATTQNNLGNTLQEQGVRTGSEASQRLLGEAVAAYHNALQIITRAHLPRSWATIQNNLGGTLKEQGIRTGDTGGEIGQRLLDKAVAAYRNALQVRTREHLPQDWATTQYNLGNTLGLKGIYTEGEAGQQLLDKAVTAYRNALQVITRAQRPQAWAAIQNNLGNALQEQGIRTRDEAGQRLLGEAVVAYRNALQIYTRAQLPQHWATVQENLGSALQDQGIRTGGKASQRLLAEAAVAYRNALQVYTQAHLPQDWARTQNKLGDVLAILGEQQGNIEHLHQAKTAIQSAYVFYREAGYSQYNTDFEERLNKLEQRIEKHPSQSLNR